MHYFFVCLFFSIRTDIWRNLLFWICLVFYCFVGSFRVSLKKLVVLTSETSDLLNWIWTVKLLFQTLSVQFSFNPYTRRTVCFNRSNEYCFTILPYSHYSFMQKLGHFSECWKTSHVPWKRCTSTGRGRRSILGSEARFDVQWSCSSHKTQVRGFLGFAVF